MKLEPRFERLMAERVGVPDNDNEQEDYWHPPTVKIYMTKDGIWYKKLQAESEA